LSEAIKTKKPSNRKVKCPICGKFNEKSLTVLDNKRYYCEDCYKKKKQESADYKALISFICELFEISQPEGLILKQIKKFKEDFGYTYKGMKTTLDYFFNIKTKKTPDNGMGVGIIPFIYKEAFEFYSDRLRIKQALKNGNVDLELPINEIQINRKDMAKKNKYKDVVHIDIEDI